MPLSPVDAACVRNSPAAQQNHLLSGLWWDQEGDNPPPPLVVMSPGEEHLLLTKSRSNVIGLMTCDWVYTYDGFP